MNTVERDATLAKSILEENVRYGLETIKLELTKDGKGAMVWNAVRQNLQYAETAEPAARRGEIRNCNCDGGHMCNADGYCGQ